MDVIKRDSLKDTKIQVIKENNPDGKSKERVKLLPSKGKFSNISKGGDMNIKCYRCDKIGHLANNRCPALGHVCTKCKKKGHYQSVCKSKPDPRVKKVEVYDESNSDGAGDDFECGQIVLEVGNFLSKRSCPINEIFIDGEITRILLDSGAKITISNDFYNSKLKHKVNWLKPDITPLPYGGEPIKLHGYFLGLIEYKGRLFSGKI